MYNDRLEKIITQQKHLHLLTEISPKFPASVFKDKLHKISKYGVEAEYPDDFTILPLRKFATAALKVKQIVPGKRTV